MFTCVFRGIIVALTVMPSATTAGAHTPKDCSRVEECVALDTLLLQTEYRHIPRDGDGIPAGESRAREWTSSRHYRTKSELIETSMDVQRNSKQRLDTRSDVTAKVDLQHGAHSFPPWDPTWSPFKTANAVKCPQPPMPNLSYLKHRQHAGPVHAKTSSKASKTKYVFLLAGAHTGSTALLSLFATSPAVGDLCQAGNFACEGTKTLEKAGLLKWGERWSPDQPADWNIALEAYKPYWTKGKKILVEKSPPNIFKAVRIYKDLTRGGHDVSFVMMVKSPCVKNTWAKKNPSNKEIREWSEINVVNALLEAKRGIPETQMHVLSYEELVSDPYAASEKLLSFLPEVISLDPSKNGLNQSFSGKAIPLTEYVIHHGLFERDFATAKQAWKPYLDEFSSRWEF